MSKHVVPVSTLVHYLKETMEGNPVLHGILVEGEVSNLRIPYSGHWYFSLKDERSSISCVMFASANRRAGFTPKNGDKVILSGDVSVYEAGGSMQIIAQGIQPSGIGALYLQLEALKKRLSEEGLFAEEHKKPLPEYPMEIALITGNQTAGREDVLITLRKRWPIAKIIEYPCPVQGAEAAPKIAEAVRRADAGNHDVILLVRGGGSFEDLWCFNAEALARTIYAAKTPIITGIGHEIDFTIADYVADVRANTPTGAVETAVPDQNEIRNLLLQYRVRMNHAVKHQLVQQKLSLEHLSQSTVLQKPERLLAEPSNALNYYEERLMRYAKMPQEKRTALELLSHRFYNGVQNQNKLLNEEIQTSKTKLYVTVKNTINEVSQNLQTQQQSLQGTMGNVMQQDAHRLEMNMKLLDAYSPLKVMERGYSITMKENQVVHHIDDVQLNDQIQIHLQDGILQAEVNHKEKKNGKDKNDI